MTLRRRVLFFGEAATLAHVARPVVLAGALDASRYEVELATGADFQWIVEQAGLRVRELDCIGTLAYLSAVQAGRPVFPYAVLQRYVRDDLRHIEAFRPELVVGDFRLSLAVSARLAGVPYLALSNAYWSPLARSCMDVPVHALTHLLGPRVVNRVFRMIAPLVLAQHSVPMHRLRRHHGMSSLGFDLKSVFTEGDVTIFADVPELVPTDPAPGGRYRYIGPVIWSPPGELPFALSADDGERPLAYIALGSSGDPSLLTRVVESLDGLDCRIALATSGAPAPSGLPPDAIVAKFLPGDVMASHAGIVICNGGSPGTHQALQQGTPVLGIPSNLDQLLNMQWVERSGAGLAVRADQVEVSRVRAAARRLLVDSRYATQARQVAAWFAAYPSGMRFEQVVQEMLGEHRGGRS